MAPRKRAVTPSTSRAFKQSISNGRAFEERRSSHANAALLVLRLLQVGRGSLKNWSIAWHGPEPGTGEAATQDGV